MTRDDVTLQRLERSVEVEEAIAKVDEKESFQSEQVDDFIVIIISVIIIINIIIKSIIPQSDAVSGCTPRYIGHDIDSEMASNLRMLCLVVLLLRLVHKQPQDALSGCSAA